MDLTEPLLALLAPTAPGDWLFPGVLLRRVSSSGGWRVTVALHGPDVRAEAAQEVHLDVEPRDAARPCAAHSARLQVSYRVARSGEPIDAKVAQRLCAALAKRLAQREDEVLERLQRDALRANEDEGGARIRRVDAGAALEPLGEPGLYGLTPYAGCVIGCRFCYAQARLRPLRRLTLIDQTPWGSYVDVRGNVATLLAEELPRVRPQLIKLCPILSDPYQAVEARFGLTRRCLEVLRDGGYTGELLVLTRSALVRRDRELLAALPGAHVGVSLPTVDDAVRAHFEPRSASVEERLALLREFRAAGVRTFAVVQPLLPGDSEALAEALVTHVDSVRIDVLHGVEGASAEFADPRFAHAADATWQDRARARLVTMLGERGVPLWDGERPKVMRRVDSPGVD